MNKHLLRIAFVVVSLVVSMQSANAQLTVVEGSALGMTPEQLVQNYLVGPGITISNVTFNGSTASITSNQVGTFATDSIATTQLGLTGGILLTSGKASIAIGPNNKANAGANAGGPGDPDLNIISNSTTHDKAVIEFDFVPQFDTVKFRYVFGSEEFFEYCNQFNDAFGFFLSGPGISGSFSNNSENIALMPGSSTLYVTINNICANTFSRWDNANGLYYQYDGLTHVFTAFAVVQPCSTYHIKLAVADAVDYAYDSGVFLEEYSFSSIGVNLNPTSNNPAIGTKAIEGCNDVQLNFALSTPPTYPYLVNYTIGGTAINGVDYTFIPDSIVFQPGQDTVAITIHPIMDLVPEGPETVIITVQQISCDGSVISDTLSIYDYLPMVIQPAADTTVCHGNEVRLSVEASGGLPPYSYAWNVTPFTDSIVHVVLPVGNNLCIATVEDLCHNLAYDTSYALVHPMPVASAGADLTIPNGTSTTLTGNASGGYGTYSYSWVSNPPGFASNLQNPVTSNLYSTTMFLLTVTDASSLCESTPDDMIVIVVGGPLSANPVANPDTICFGDSTQLFALGGGGAGLYTYSWSSNPPGFNSTQSNPTVAPQGNTTYSLSLSDGFNQVNGTATVTVLPLPVILLGPQDSLVCIYDTVTLDAGNPGSIYRWSNGAESRTITVASSGISYEVQTYSVKVSNAAGCADSATINLVFSFGACTGIVEHPSPKVMIYPNPASGSFTVSSSGYFEPLQLEFFNLFGQRVLHDSWPAQNGPGFKKQYELQGCAPGLYILRWTDGTSSGTIKLLYR